MGQYYKHDAVNQILSFSVDESLYDFDMKWQKNFWGNVRFEPMTVRS